MEIHPQVQKLSESNGVQTARDVKRKDADCSGGLNLFEAKIAFRLGEIHIYLKKHQIQTSEFQSFWDRWIVFSPRRNDDFWKKRVFHDLTFRSAGLFVLQSRTIENKYSQRNIHNSFDIWLYHCIAKVG